MMDPLMVANKYTVAIFNFTTSTRHVISIFKTSKEKQQLKISTEQLMNIVVKTQSW